MDYAKASEVFGSNTFDQKSMAVDVSEPVPEPASAEVALVDVPVVVEAPPSPSPPH